MCVLLVLDRMSDRWPLVVAANRDEVYDRPGLPPEWERSRHEGFPDPGGEMVPYIAPRDPRAGGTWLGLTRGGLFVALTNRQKRPGAPAERSRGLLCRDALATGTLEAARRHLTAEVKRRRYDPFNLLVADGRASFVLHFDGAVRLQDLGPGRHVLINDHDVGEESLQGLEADLLQPILRGLDHSPDELIASLLEALRDDHPRLPGGESICKKGEVKGTMSATIVLVHQDGMEHSRLLHANGSPRTTELLEIPLGPGENP
jgi:uncharacterized protein with NRDE domain